MEIVPTSTGWPRLMAILDFFDDGREFFFFGAIDHVRIILADHFAIGRHHIDVQVINFGELARFRVGGPRHAGQFLVHAEIVLEGDGGQRLIFVRDLDAFFRLHRLVQPVAPPAPGHEAAREFIDDKDLTVFDDIVDVTFVERVRLQGFHDVVHEIHVGRIVQIVHAEELFDARIPVFCQRGRFGLFLDRVILLRFELGDDGVDPVIEVGRLVRRARNDQWRPRFID